MFIPPFFILILFHLHIFSCAFSSFLVVFYFVFIILFSRPFLSKPIIERTYMHSVRNEVPNGYYNKIEDCYFVLIKQVQILIFNNRISTD